MKLRFKKGTSGKQVSSKLKFNFRSYSRKDLLFINICPLNLTYFLWYKKNFPQSFETDSHIGPAGQKFQPNQDGLELLILCLHLPSAGITGMSHHIHTERNHKGSLEALLVLLTLNTELLKINEFRMTLESSIRTGEKLESQYNKGSTQCSLHTQGYRLSSVSCSLIHL